MKLTKVLAIAAIASTSTAAYAGNPTTAGVLDDQVIILPEDTDGSAGSLGSLGGAAPAIIALVLLGAVAASDSGGGS